MASPAIDWTALESPLSPSPRFYVQAPDGKRDWPERGLRGRQETFAAQIHRRGVDLLFHHVPNEGRRNPNAARRSGIRGGVFDNQVFGRAPLAAAIEIKGYDARGQAGKLSDAQVEWGNAMVDLGWHVACFFCPFAALDWLRDCGFVIRERVVA